ncbi:MAG: J domain-containing protein [Eubacteriales bacterium]|nr:J domain-containing protein [Clostridiales bacterium]MDY5836036.1 J domain-containing protein [Eubacteriales bacterium]
MATKDPYKVLGVDPTASMDEIKKAYRAMAKKYHPDRHSDPVAKELAEERMAEINAAYEAIESGTAQRQSNQSSQNPFGDWPFGPNSTSSSRPQGQNPWSHQQSWHEGRTYRQSGPTNMGGSSCCDQLCCLCLADSCCECMGGDLCRCM